MGAQEVGVLRRVDVDDPPTGRTQIETIEQLAVARLGHDQLAIRVGDVTSQLGPPSGRVDADDRIARERRCTQPRHHLGRVVEQHADVAGGAAIERSEEVAGSGRTSLGELGPRARLVLEAKRDAITVIRALADQVRDVAHSG